MSQRPHEKSPAEIARKDAKDAGKDRDVAETILQSAALLMPDYGYSRLTMRDLASQAGIGLGTAYSYFRGKEEIAAALVARGVDTVHTVMESYLTIGTSLDCVQRMLVARVVVRQGQTHGQRHPINEDTPELEAVLAPRRAAWHTAEQLLLVRAIQKGQAEGTIVSGTPEDLALPLLWATDGLVREALRPPAAKPLSSANAETLSSANAEPPSDDIQTLLPQKIGQVADLLVTGIQFRRSQDRYHSFPPKSR